MNHQPCPPVGARTTGATPPTARPPRQTVVLLHSSGASSRQWDPLIEHLRPNFEVLAIDLHGHGGQDPWAGAEPLSLHDEAALALPVVERAGGAHLVGHSYGGAVAMHIAAARPALVRSLAVYEPVLFGVLEQHEPLGAAMREARSLAGRLQELLDAGLAVDAAELFIDHWSGEGSFARLGPKRQSPIVQRMPSIAEQFDALREPLPLQRLTQLDAPMLCLTGTSTTTVCRRIGQLLRALLPGAQHERLAGLGHMGPTTHPAQVNARLLRFLGVDAGPPRHPQAALASARAVCV